MNAARTARTFASLLKAGVSMTTTIGITRDVVQNLYFKEVLTDAEASVERGEALSRSFMLREDLYPPLVGEMIAVGEEPGELEKMLSKVADFYEEQVEAAVSALTSIIEPLIIAFLGIVVGGIVIAMFLPIFKLTELVGR